MKEKFDTLLHYELILCYIMNSKYVKKSNNGRIKDINVTFFLAFPR